MSKQITEFGLTELLESASTEKRHPAAARISDALQNRVGDVTLPGANVAHSYWLPAHELRDLTAGVPSAGGNLTTAERFMALLTAARPATVLAAAGAQVVTVNGVGEVVYPQAEELVSSGWIVEGQAAKQVQLKFEPGQARPHTVAGRIQLSHRLIRQGMEGMEVAILSELARSNRSVAEAGFFNGSGSEGEPLGLFNTTGTRSITFDGAAPTYTELADEMLSEFVEAEGDLSRAVWFMPPKLLLTLMTTLSSTGVGYVAQVHGPRRISVASLPVFTSNAIPAGKVLLMDPTRIGLVYWNEPAAVVDRFSNGQSVSGAAELITFDDCDIVAGRPDEIVVGSAA